MIPLTLSAAEVKLPPLLSFGERAVVRAFEQWRGWRLPLAKGFALAERFSALCRGPLPFARVLVLTFLGLPHR